MAESPRQKPRIGVLLALGRCEAKKQELVSISKRVPPRPWVKEAPAESTFHHPDQGPTKACTGIPTDVSIGEYIKFNHGDAVDIDYIHPKDITARRLKANDINFLLIYDLLEAFHTDRAGPIFHRFKDVLARAGNVYPNLEYQQFVYSKLTYYNHLMAKGLPVVATITISAQQWAARAAGGSFTAAQDVLDEIGKRGMKKFIIKPVYGQESKDCKILTLDVDKRRFRRILCYLLGKYPGIVIQEFIKDFGITKTCPELRMYFIGRKYQFTAIATKYKIFTLKGEMGTTKAYPLPALVDVKALKSLAVKVIDSLPSVELKRAGRSIILPKLLTRVDLGCIRDGVFKPWVNEVEFVPSLYVEDHNVPIDATMGERMFDIAKQYLGLRPGRAAKAKRLSMSKSRSRIASSSRPERVMVSKACPLSIRWPRKRRISNFAGRVAKRARGGGA